MQDSIERTIWLDAPVDRVWRAISDFQEFGTWFRAVLSGPFVQGTVIQGRSTYPGHEHLTWDMEIVEVVTNQRVTFKWPAYYGDDVERDAAQDPYLTSSFSLEPEGDGTRLTLRETGFSQLPPDYAPMAFRLNDGGWAEQMKNIATHVAG